MRNKSAHKRTRSSLFVSLVLLLVLCMCTACKPTDFFTEVIITPFSDTVDENNTDKPVVNSPDAEQETKEKSALDISKDAPKTEQEENISVYSSDPNTETKTRHSVFDSESRYEDIEASDPVKLVPSNSKDSVDGSVSAKDKSSKGDNAQDNKQQEEQDSSAAKNEGKNEKAGDDGSSGKGNSGKGKKGNKGKNNKGDKSKGKDKNSDKKGDEENESSGKMADEITYDPDEPMKNKLQQAQKIGALGQAAVMAQALGGKGTVVAMDEYTYSGKDSDGKRGKNATAQSFKDVFSAHLDASFKSDAVLWKADGSSSDDIKANFKKMVKAVGKNGVIVYEGSTSDTADMFNKSQLKTLKSNNIQLVPVEFSTYKSIRDAATCLGKILQGSEETEYDVKEAAKDYNKTLDNIVKAVAKTHGGNLAQFSTSVDKVYSDYDPINNTEYQGVYSVVATDFTSGVKYKNSKFKLKTEQGLLFTHISYEASPLSYWLQAAGVVDMAAGTKKNSDESSSNLQVVWQTNGATFNLSNFSSTAYNAFNLISKYRGKNSTHDTSGYCLLQIPGNGSTSGLGSSSMPYLVVSATQSEKASAVKKAVVKSMQTPKSTYYAYKWNSKKMNTSEDGIQGYVGYEEGYEGSVFHDRYGDQSSAYESSVRENPVGLLGSWTSGSMESVLESVWIANVYSQKPVESSTYNPVTNMGKFSVNIGGTTCTSLKQAVTEFYKTFYHYDDASNVYASVVTGGEE